MAEGKPNPLTALPEFRKEVVRAIQAIAASAHYNGEGEAPAAPSHRDCKIALDWIITEVGGYYDVPTPSADDPSGRCGDFFNGRRFVAKQIVMAMKIKPETLKT
jgi:hypothetical protein